jgi:4-hydroxybenzoyl-CoA thioesterase
MSYTRIMPIEFNHCDPAGIVFYPRYFEMVNSVVENFFADVLGYSFARMHTGDVHNGVPTVSVRCDFKAPSRLGDKVPFTLTVTSVGRSSLGLRIVAAVGGETRLETENTLVWIEGGRATPWPDEIRARLEAELQKGGQDG